MKSWIVKAIVQKTISFLPRSHSINHFFQRHVTHGLTLDDSFMEDKLTHVHKHLAFFNTYGLPAPDPVAFELGTGWFPIIPVCLFLSGFSRVVTVDIVPLLRRENVLKTMERLLEWNKQQKLKPFLPGFIPERITVLEKAVTQCRNYSVPDLLSLVGIEAVQGNITRIKPRKPLANLVISNNTLEHITEASLGDVLLSIRKWALPHAMMSHFIDMTDHFSHFDPSISPYHFLRYSDTVWQWINNSIQPQNRLRICDYLHVFRKYGIYIIHEEDRPGYPDIISQFRMSKHFQKYTDKDLAVTHSYLVGMWT